MFRLGNADFKYCAASGALGFNGEGYWHQKPFKWCLNLPSFAVITKTLTINPRVGNFQWHHPWRSIQYGKDNVVNAMGLPNKGLAHWIKSVAPHLYKRTIVSLALFSQSDADKAAEMLNILQNWPICGVELNWSCVNAPKVDTNEQIAITRQFAQAVKLPIVAKFGIGQNYLTKCERMQGFVAGADLINSVSWGLVHHDQKSPLGALGGGVSGPQIASLARNALVSVKKCCPDLQIISGGGIWDAAEARRRFDLGADAISFGTAFTVPWRPMQIVRQLEKGKAKRLVF